MGVGATCLAVPQIVIEQSGKPEIFHWNVAGTTRHYSY